MSLTVNCSQIVCKLNSLGMQRINMLRLELVQKPDSEAHSSVSSVDMPLVWFFVSPSLANLGLEDSMLSIYYLEHNLLFMA